MINLLLIHALGAVGGLFAKSRKLPAGAMLGAMFLVILLNVVTGMHASYPTELRRVIQIVSGLIVAARFTKNDLMRLKSLLLPVLMLLVMLTVINAVFAGVIGSASQLSLITALFAAAPGGLTDLALVAADFGADPEQVAILQILRFVVVVMCTPVLIRKLQARKPAPAPSPAKTDAGKPAEPPSKKTLALRAALSIGVAAAGSLLAQWARLPAGAIIGAILATVILNLTTGKVYVPPVLKPTVQISAGCYIGTRITLTVLASLPELIIPMLLLILEVLIMTFGISFLIHKVTKMDLPTAIFSCVPGGMTELGIMAEEMGLDIPRVILMHTCRVIFVICMMPVMLGVLAG
jgi:membrane AbrB-like protein